MEYIARIHSDFPTKFGIPRQSGLADALISKIVFEPKFRNPDCLRGIEQWSHLWLLWHFDRIEDGLWSPTVAPPKLGGKTRVGVFATRSPFRPNPIGLSSVKLAGVELHTKDGPVLYVAGADLADRTPIYDIKPYLPYADSHPDAVDAFSSRRDASPLTVEFPDALLEKIPAEKRAGLIQALCQNPRPTRPAATASCFPASTYALQLTKIPCAWSRWQKTPASRQISDNKKRQPCRLSVGLAHFPDVGFQSLRTAGQWRTCSKALMSAPAGSMTVRWISAGVRSS